MNCANREKKVASLFHTSVDDCKCSLTRESDPQVLMDLLIKCHSAGHKTRERLVRHRIAELIKNA